MPERHSNVMGGSTAQRRIHCVASYSLEEEAEKQVGKKEGSDYAMQGTVLHSAMEMLLTAVDPFSGGYEQQHMKALEDLEGSDLGYGEKWVITADHIERKIKPAWDAFMKVFTDYELEDWFMEQGVSLETVIPGAFGTADLIAIDASKRLHILDWKFGDGKMVAAKDNMGLTFYAGATLYDENPELIEMCEGIKGVVLHIVQPKNDGGDALASWETTEGYVEDFISLAAEAMDKARGDAPPCSIGSWCDWCGAKNITCKKHLETATDALSNDPKSMSSVELSVALKAADDLAGWIKNVRKLAQTELENGAVIPGYKLVKKTASRKWASEEDAEKALRSARYPVRDMFKKTLISAPQLEKAKPKLYARLEAEHVTKTSSGLTVVSNSDKREAVVSSMNLLANALPEQ